MKTKSNSKAPQAKKRLGVVNVKMTAADRKELIKKARLHAKGNLSAWLRHSGKVHTPKKGEKVQLKAA